MSSTTKPFEEKMNASVNHLVHELASIRAGRANPAILDKVAVDYYGSPTPIQQIAAIASPDPRQLHAHSADCRRRRGRGPHPDHLPLGPLDAQAHLQGHPDQRYRHQPHR